MKIIVAGMPKTGTKSMNQALTMLGYKVYDVFENMFELAEDYIKIVDEGWTTEDFRRMYEDVDATVDFPGHFFWEEIHRAFPDAKVILTVRDNEEVWVKSMVKQLEANEASHLVNAMVYLSPSHRRAMGFVGKLLSISLGISPPTFFRRKASDFNRNMLMRIYRAHNAYVKQTAPKDKLLIYQCSEGWGPLCSFLGVPVPDKPFPHKNKGAEIVKEMMNLPFGKTLQREATVSAAMLLVVSIATGVVIYKYGIIGIFKGVYSQTETLLGKLHLL